MISPRIDPSCQRWSGLSGPNRERCVNCFTLRIIIVLMETIKDLDISTDSDCPPPYDDYDADAEPQDSSTDLTWSRSRDSSPLANARGRSAVRVTPPGR